MSRTPRSFAQVLPIASGQDVASPGWDRISGPSQPEDQDGDSHQGHGVAIDIEIVCEPEIRLAGVLEGSCDVSLICDSHSSRHGNVR